MANENLTTAQRLERLGELALDNVGLSDAIQGVTEALCDDLVDERGTLRSQQLSFAAKVISSQHGKVAGEIGDIVRVLKSKEVLS